MKRLLMIMLAVAIAATDVLTQGQAERTVDAQFKAAQHKEEVEGDLQGAIAAYQAIVKSGNRAAAARALLRMAACYQKLGDAKAHAIYEQVVRDYADQKESAGMARARLAERSAASNNATAMRRLWSGQNLSDECGLSFDGRYLTCPFWETGDLGLRDLVTGTDRLLTRNGWAGDQYAQFSSISRDSKQVAYAWFNGKDRYELRLVGLTEPDARAQTVFDSEEVDFLMPSDWLPDGETLMVQIFRKDRAVQLGLFSIRDRSLKVLKTIDWSGAGGRFVSPDGKYVGYDLALDETRPVERDVFVLALDGSRESTVVSHPGLDLMMGWSADGRHLLFASDRGGRPGLWALAMDGRQPAGEPLLIRPDVTPVSLGVTRSGALHVVVQTGIRDVRIADVDFEAGAFLSEPKSVVSSFVGRNSHPAWSPDGEALAYVSQRDSARRRVIVIRTISSGATRELEVPLRYFGPPRWSPDGQSILLKGEDLKGRPGLFKVDIASGALALLPFPAGPCQFSAQVSPDGKKLYFNGGTACLGRAGSVFLEGDMETGSVREVVGDPAPAGLMLSPDGRALAGINQRTNAIELISVDGGAPTTLWQVAEGQLVRPFGIKWSADGRSLVLTVVGKSGNHLLRVPLNGGTPRRVDVSGGAGFFEGGQLSPNGRTIAYSTGEYTAELWRLENFLPAAAAGR